MNYGILLGIIFCIIILYILIWVFIKPFKKLAKILLNSALGGVSLWVLNLLLTLFELLTVTSVDVWID